MNGSTIMRSLGVLVVLIILGVGGFVAFAWQSELTPIDPPVAGSFEPELVQRGATLAAIGNCNVCHTKPGGEVFAGGLAMPTPFGTVYSTNITPDPDTGIGRWSQEAFTRSMREGVDREGRHLYPAFPYDHFTKVTDEDNQALYAYLMTRKPISAEARDNDLPFPLNVRLVLAGWKLLFFREGEYQPDASQSAEWNRGHYLSEGLGHCGSCHTPRNGLGAEKKEELYAGAQIEGWTAYALNAASPAAIPWTVDSLTHYLSNGWEEKHGVARGPMAPVTANLMSASDEDARAIATYVTSVMGEPSADRKARGDAATAETTRHAPGIQVQAAGAQTVPVDVDSNNRGALIYAAACSTCHDAGRPVPYGGLPMNLSTATYGPTPLNPINVILYGLPAPEGDKGPIMPGFSGVLDDAQMVDLLTYIRATYSDQPAWENIGDVVKRVRSGNEHTDISPLNSGSSAPANPTRRETSW